MLELSYCYNEDYSLKDVSFRGLTGLEDVSNVKEALNIMTVGNPAIGFMENVEEGLYNDLPDEEYQKAMDSIKCICDLWHFEGAPKDDQNGECHVNPLTLLANAIELISLQNAQLRKYGHGKDDENRKKEKELLKTALTKQSDETAEKMRRNMLEAAFVYTECRFRWEFLSEVEKEEMAAKRRVAYSLFRHCTNTFVRYLNTKGIAKLEKLGDDHKRNGDLACGMVSGTGVGNR